MFERFTDRARRVVVLAQEHARMLNHNYIGAEHLLLGLIAEQDGVAAEVLRELGATLDAARDEVVRLIGQGGQAPQGHIPFTPRAKKVIELANREAVALESSVIGTEELLLGLIREGDGVGVKVLTQLCGDLPGIRQRVLQRSPRMTSAGPAARSRRRGAGQLTGDAAARLGRAEDRLAGIERWVGMAPDLGDIERELARLRQAKEAAIEQQDYESAAVVRDQEAELVVRAAEREEEWAASGGSEQSVAADLRQLRAEVARLAELLRRHGIDAEPPSGG